MSSIRISHQGPQSRSQGWAAEGHVTLGLIGCQQQKQRLLVEAKKKFSGRNGIVYRVEGEGIVPDFREGGDTDMTLLGQESEENLTHTFLNNVHGGRRGCPREKEKL